MDSFVTSDGVQLMYKSYGDSSATQTLLLLHGWSGSSKYFSLNAQPLADKGIHVIEMDLRFHGSSGKPDFGFHIARLAADVHELTVHLNLKEAGGVFLLGTSMGAAIIWSYIELFGQALVKGAVFVDQAPLQNISSDWRHASKGCYDIASLTRLQCALHHSMEDFAAGNAACCLSLPLDQSVLDTLTEETLKCKPAHLAQLMADHTQLDWRTVLPRITVPCLNVVGCNSGVFPVEGTSEVGRCIPGCKTVYFTRANHWCYLEEPTAFNDTVAAFILGKDLSAAVATHPNSCSESAA